VTTAGPGRPRLSRPLREGATAREQILDAAAELFTTQGYATTSTRAVAESVGVRQASLYHHFATKEEVLEALLASTVDPTLPVAEALARQQPGSAADAVVRLHALCLFDGAQLCGTRWNLGALYLLPELRSERFAPFRAARDRLRGLYGVVGGAVTAQTGGPPCAGELAFRLVESLIAVRADGVLAAGAADDVAEACLRVAGWTGEVAAVRSASAALLARVRSPS
jgi:AcrR family transcriptional regulator